MRRVQVQGTGSSRRRFLSWVGTGGLATAGLVFGDVPPASATGATACCNLYVCPNVTFTHCRSGSNYTWNCMYTSTTGCSCCEHGGLGSLWDGHSAYYCSHV